MLRFKEIKPFYFWAEISIDFSLPKTSKETTYKIIFQSLGDIAGHFNVIAKALRPLSLADMKAAEAKLEAQIATLPVAQIKVIRTLFYDVVAMIGTNPAVMLIKECLLDTTK